MTPALRRKLDALVERREEVERLLADPAVAADQARFRNLSREFATLQPVADALAAEAQARIDALETQADQGDAVAQWEAGEAALGLGVEARRVIETRLDALDIAARSPVTVVSSLPLLSMTRDEAHACVDAMVALIESRPGSRLIQYTYASPHLRPFKDIPVGWRWRRATTIWANLPPATVWTLEQASHPSHTHNGFH